MKIHIYSSLKYCSIKHFSDDMYKLCHLTQLTLRNFYKCWKILRTIFVSNIAIQIRVPITPITSIIGILTLRESSRLKTYSISCHYMINSYVIFGIDGFETTL